VDEVIVWEGGQAKDNLGLSNAGGSETPHRAENDNDQRQGVQPRRRRGNKMFPRGKTSIACRSRMPRDRIKVWIWIDASQVPAPDALRKGAEACVHVMVENTNSQASAKAVVVDFAYVDICHFAPGSCCWCETPG
jgi:hypothetical protein